MTIQNLVFLCFYQLLSLIHSLLSVISSFKDALLQHAKRSVYHAGIWATSDNPSKAFHPLMSSAGGKRMAVGFPSG